MSLECSPITTQALPLYRAGFNTLHTSLSWERLNAKHCRRPDWRRGGGIRGRPAVRGKRTHGGRAGQRVEEQGTWASHTQKHSEAGYGRPVDRGAWTAKTVKRTRQQPAHPQYANYWAPLTRKRHTMPHSAQSQHTKYWAPRTRKQHQQEHRLQRPTERSNPTQHAKGRTGECPGPRKGATTRRNVTQGGRSSTCEQGDNCPAPAHQKYVFPLMAWDKQCGHFPTERSTGVYTRKYQLAHLLSSCGLYSPYGTPHPPPEITHTFAFQRSAGKGQQHTQKCPPSRNKGQMAVWTEGSEGWSLMQRY